MNSDPYLHAQKKTTTLYQTTLAQHLTNITPELILIYLSTVLQHLENMTLIDTAQNISPVYLKNRCLAHHLKRLLATRVIAYGQPFVSWYASPRQWNYNKQIHNALESPNVKVLW